MKQKYIITKNNEKNEMLIQELAEVDKDVMALLSEEAYDQDIVKTLMGKGENFLIKELRTESFFPPSSYMAKISNAIFQLYDSEERDSIEILIDDKDAFIVPNEDDEFGELDEIPEDLNEFDQLLGDGSEALKKTSNGVDDEENPPANAKE